jgi:general secretion pathway protein M
MNATASGSFAELKTRTLAWYQAREPREQQLLLAGAVIVPVLIVALIVLGLHGVVNRLEKRVVRKRADLEYVQSVAPILRGMPVRGASSESLNALIDRSTRDAGLAGSITGIDPAGPSQVRVRLENASFDTVVGWLVELQQAQGVAISSATIDRAQAPGRVNATLTLARP